MNAKRAWLLALYPRRWRARYGEEFLALLEDTPLSPRMVLDCLRGALDAHVRPAITDEAPHPTADAPGAGVPADVTPTTAAPLPITPRVPGQPGWESVLDRILREARERGEFDNLPGTGQPLNLEEDPWAGEWALAYRVLKQAGETLPWIALGKQIDADMERLAGLLDLAAKRLSHRRTLVWTDDERQRYEAERARYRAGYLDAAARLDQKLADFNLQVPSWRLQRGRLSSRVAAERFDAACPPIRGPNPPP
jgi:DnaJ homolog subfamily C member 28